jgi:hypothetical protein
MNVCNQCSSISRDPSGVCAGRGAAWPLPVSEASANHGASQQHLPYANLRSQIRSSGLVDVRPKQVWIAVTLASVGPIGPFYCTPTGALVMMKVSLLRHLTVGGLSFLIVLPICAIWAWRAVRESASLTLRLNQLFVFP